MCLPRDKDHGLFSLVCHQLCPIDIPKVVVGLNQQLSGIYSFKTEGRREEKRGTEREHTWVSPSIFPFMSGTGQSTVGRSKENSAKSRLWETLEGNWPGFFSDYIVRKQIEMGRGPRD